MKKTQNKNQQTNNKSAEVESTEEEIISSEEIEISEPEEMDSDQFEEEDDEEENLDEEDSADEDFQFEEDESDSNSEENQVSDVEENPKSEPVSNLVEITNKQKIKALKRAIENKNYSLERENQKIKDWKIQATDRDKKANDEFMKRKSELESLLQKNQIRYDKRIAKTKKWWWDYCDNHKITKVAKIEQDVILLLTELSKLESLEPKETTK